MVIIVDTREQNPYSFSNIQPIPPVVKVGTLKTGDYSIEGFIDKVCVERKAILDIFGTFGKGRKRFEKELERMAAMEYAAIMLEADWLNILRRPPTRSQLNPKTIYASVIAWEQRYRVSFWACPNRAFAEKTTYRILDRFWRDRM